MNISNFQKIFPQSIFRHCTIKTLKPTSSNFSWALTKAAALVTGVFLSYAVSKKLEDDPEITAYKKTHPHVSRSLFGFGPFKKVSAEGPFYHCTQEKNLIKIIENGAVKISCHGLFIENKSQLNLKEGSDTSELFQAFVSIKPEFDPYGRYALVFNDNLRELDNGLPRSFMNDDYFYFGHTWVAFTEDLPLDARCFEKIIFRPQNYREEEREIERKELEEKILKIAGHSIIVEIDRG